MAGKVILPTAYLPPLEYFCLIVKSDEIILESEENFTRQTYRNRCYVLSSQGSHLLSVPVYEASRHKVPIREVRIDYSKKWQHLHLMAFISYYRCSPYFDFFFEPIEKIILDRYELLWDLNMALLKRLLSLLKIKRKINITGRFIPPAGDSSDFRYSLEPGRMLFEHRHYIQVFSGKQSFVPNMSIVDLLYNLGPDSTGYLASLTLKKNGLPSGNP